MDLQEFREHGKSMVDYIANYWETLRERKPFPDTVQPGYIWDTFPQAAPNNGENWENIFTDTDTLVTDANSHWMHPHFYAYYPSANSYPSIIADMLGDALGGRHMHWESSPANAELELVVVDWLAKSIGLPEHMLNCNEGSGGGMIVGTASEGFLTALLAARTQMCVKFGVDVIPKLVAYCSDQAHSSIERGALLAGVTMKKLATTKSDLYGLNLEAFTSAVKEDLENGMLPFFGFPINYVTVAWSASHSVAIALPSEISSRALTSEASFQLCACIGTTSSCAIDNIPDLGKACAHHSMWLHVDAAYAASAAICPEYRYILKGVETVDSFSWNPHKWLLMHFECSTLWMKNLSLAKNCTKGVEPDLKLQLQQHELAEPKDHQVQMSRRFRALKIWIVMRKFGVEGLQHHVRKTCNLASKFAEKVSLDAKFEMFVPVTLGLTCFRLKGTNEQNEVLMRKINEDKQIHLVPSKVDGTFFLRFAVCSPFTTEKDIETAWNVIKSLQATIKSLCGDYVPHPLP